MSINQNFPNVFPSVSLDFENSKTLDPRITFTRSSVGTYVGADGLIKTAAVSEARFDHNPTTGESLGLLIEEQRTNSFLYSGDLSNTDGWTRINSIIVSSYSGSVARRHCKNGAHPVNCPNSRRDRDRQGDGRQKFA